MSWRFIFVLKSVFQQAAMEIKLLHPIDVTLPSHIDPSSNAASISPLPARDAVRIHETMFDELFRYRLPDDGFTLEEVYDEYFGLMERIKPGKAGIALTRDDNGRKGRSPKESFGQWNAPTNSASSDQEIVTSTAHLLTGRRLRALWLPPVADKWRTGRDGGRCPSA